MTNHQAKIEKIKKFIILVNTDEFKASYSLCKIQLYKIVKKLLPQKWKLKLKFGFDDPYYTGQAMVYYSLVHPFIYNNSEVIPDFDNAIFDGSIHAKGHIRIITLVIVGVRIFLSKDIKRTLYLLKRI